MSKHEYTTKEKEEAFVLYFDDKPMHVIATGWNDWRPPKKIYFTIGAAKSGITQLPDGVDVARVTIRRYVPAAEEPIKHDYVRGKYRVISRARLPK